MTEPYKFMKGNTTPFIAYLCDDHCQKLENSSPLFSKVCRVIIRVPAFYWEIRFGKLDLVNQSPRT